MPHSYFPSLTQLHPLPILQTLFGGLHAYFDKDITTLLFLNWIINDHDDLEDVKNYIGSFNENNLDPTNMGPDFFANVVLRNTYQSENNFVSNIRNFYCWKMSRTLPIDKKDKNTTYLIFV